MRNTTILTYAVVGLTLTFASVPAWGQGCENSFEATLGDAWQQTDNWSQGHKPTSTEVACIPDGETAVIYKGLCDGGTVDGEGCQSDTDCIGGGTCDEDTVQVAEDVVVDGYLSVNAFARLFTGTLNIDDEGTVWVGSANGSSPNFGAMLAIDEDSVIDGTLVVDGQGKLLVGADLTIEGTGGVMRNDYEGSCAELQAFVAPLGVCDGGAYEGGPCTSVPTGDVDCPGGTCDLPSPLPTLTLLGADSDPTNLALRGSWQTWVPLDNQAQVVADDYNNPFIIGADGNCGTGFWMAETHPSWGGVGVLRVDGSIEGSGTWVIDDRGKITINTDSTSLSGDVEIYTGNPAGVLRLKQDFWTTGHLTMSGGSIILSEGVYAQFE